MTILKKEKKTGVQFAFPLIRSKLVEYSRLGVPEFLLEVEYLNSY